MLLLVDGLKVRNLRQRLGMSQRECCKKAGISRRTLQRIENSQHVRPDSVRALAKVLGVNPKLLAVPKGRLLRAVA